MAIKSIFLFAPAETALVGKGPVGFAFSLAKAHGAHLTIFTVALDVTTPERETDAQSVADHLCAAAKATGIDCTLITEHSHVLGVHEVVAEHARLHDISVIGSQSLGLLHERMVAEYLMFESGRPVIVVPEAFDLPYQNDVFGMAWDNTPAAARALGDAITLLEPANMHFLTIIGEKQMPTDLDSNALVTVMGRRGVVAGHVNAALFGRSIAEALQQEALAAGSNMLVMGAFGHSRWRSFVLGSATADILKNIQIPTLLSH
jgi:nucleotide-binding universal stress UspA family protein